MYNFPGLYLNQPIIRISFNKLGSFKIFGYFFQTKFRTVFSTYSSPLKYIAKPREPPSFECTKARAKFEKDSIKSEMSFYISTGGGVTSSNYGTYPGTSVCFQFWVTNDLLKLVAVCNVPEAVRFGKSI